MVKNIKIKRDTREILRECQEGKESVDAVINRVLDKVESDMINSHVLFGSTNVDVSKDTMERLKCLKVYDHESYDAVLRRALSLYMF